MSNIRYSPLPGQSTAQERELEVVFAYDSEDDEHDGQNAESKPLNPNRTQSPPPPLTPENSQSTYDFENLDYDYPPPGSPPTRAIPNAIGNTNGNIPTAPPQIPHRGPNLFQRIFPGLRRNAPTRPVGGGIDNDGVFANLNAKPSRGRVVSDGDNGVHVVPEEVQAEAPPSYATAQADAVPPYWETTIHTSSGFGALGEIMVDGLPTGSVFSFLWNFLVSMSFQFVGFLLTFLLHSTHAAKLGSRAGLGITLIHYGFYLRTKSDGFSNEFINDDGSWSAPATPAPIPTGTMYPNNTDTAFNNSVAEGTSEWLSFLLMTVGWFVLLTSVLSFWRVKRWERYLVASNPSSETQETTSTETRDPLVGVRQAFGFPGAVWRNLRHTPTSSSTTPHDEEAMLESNGEPRRRGSVDNNIQHLDYRALFAIQRVREERLNQSFRDAGLIL